MRTPVFIFAVSIVCATLAGGCDTVESDADETPVTDAGGGVSDVDGAADSAPDDADDTQDSDPGVEPDVHDAGPDDDADSGVGDAATDGGETDAADVDDASDTDADVDDATEPDVDDASAPDADDGSPFIRLGTGWDELDPYGGYEPLDERGSVRIAEGIQGGFHVWGGFEGRGMDASDVESTWELTNEDGVLVGGGFFVSEMRAYEGRLATASLTVFIDLSLDVTTLDGVPHELCVTVRMADDSELGDCATVRPSCCDYL